MSDRLHPRTEAAAAPAGPLASPGYWLHHAALAWRRELGARLRDLDLTPTQFDVLGSLSWQSRGGDVTQQMVADFAGIDRMMASKVVRTLEQRGYLERRAHAGDARALILTLTGEGRRVAAESTAHARAFDAALFGAPADSADLRRDLAAFLDRLDAS